MRAEEEIFQAEKVFGGYAFLVPWRYALAEEKLFKAEKVCGGYAFFTYVRGTRVRKKKLYMAEKVFGRLVFYVR